VFFSVEGEPISQGSMRLFTAGDGGAYMTHASSRLSAWRKKIVDVIKGSGEAPLEGPVYAYLYFRLPRPKTVKRGWPTVKPDLDKLARACFDACEAAGIVKTDAQIVALYTDKKYSVELPPHVKIYLEEIN
jgi:Holliday junction resolvase RusA-like endonuclease